MGHDFVKEIKNEDAKNKFQAAKEEFVRERNSVLKEWIVAQLRSLANELEKQEGSKEAKEKRKKADEVEGMGNSDFQAYINRHPELIDAMVQNEAINTKIDEDNQPYNHFERRLAEVSTKYGQALGKLAEIDTFPIEEVKNEQGNLGLQAQIGGEKFEIKGFTQNFYSFAAERSGSRGVKNYRMLNVEELNDSLKSKKEKNPFIIALSAVDEDGMRLPADSGLQVYLEYNETGRLVDAVMPMPIKFAGNGDKAQAYFENEGKVYTLPFDKNGYESIKKEVAKRNQEFLEVTTNRKEPVPDHKSAFFSEVGQSKEYFNQTIDKLEKKVNEEKEDQFNKSLFDKSKELWNKNLDAIKQVALQHRAERGDDPKFLQAVSDLQSFRRNVNPEYQDSFIKKYQKGELHTDWENAISNQGNMVLSNFKKSLDKDGNVVEITSEQANKFRQDYKQQQQQRKNTQNAAAQETLVINKSEAGEGSQLNTPAASQLAATSNHAAAKGLSSQQLKDAGQQELPEQNIAPKTDVSKKLTLEQFNSQLRPDSEKFVAQYSKIPILTGKKNYVIDGNEVREFVNNDDAKIYVASEERKAREQEFNNKVQERKKANEAAKIEYIAEEFDERGVFNFNNKQLNSDNQPQLKQLDDSKEAASLIKNFAKSSSDTQRDIIKKLYEIQTGKSIDNNDQKISDAIKVVIEQNIEPKLEEQKKEAKSDPVSNLPESKKTLNIAAVNAELDKKGFGMQSSMLKVSELSKKSNTSIPTVEGEHYGPALKNAAQGSNNTPAAFNPKLNAGIDGAAAEEQKNGSDNSLPKADQQVVEPTLALAQDLVNNTPKLPKPVPEEGVGKGPSLQNQDVTPDVKQTDVSSGLQKTNDASEARFQGVKASNAERLFIDVLKDLTASQFENRFDGIRKVFRVQTERDKIVGKNDTEFAAYANDREGQKVIGKVLEDKKNLEQLMRASIAEQKKVMENFGGQAIAPDQIKEKDAKKTITIYGPNKNIVLELEESRDKNDPTKGRNIDFPTQLKEGAQGPVSLAFALLDKDGKQPPKDKALYFTLKYDESGKLVDMQMPQIVKRYGLASTATPFVEVDNEVYSLPVNRGKLRELQEKVEENTGKKKITIIQEAADKGENQQLSALNKAKDKHKDKNFSEVEKLYNQFQEKNQKAVNENGYKRVDIRGKFDALWNSSMEVLNQSKPENEQNHTLDVSKLGKKLGELDKLLEIDIKISNPKTDPKERTKEVHKAINGLQGHFEKLPDEHAKDQKEQFAKLKSKFDKGVDANGNYDFGLSQEQAEVIMNNVNKISSEKFTYFDKVSKLEEGALLLKQEMETQAKLLQLQTSNQLTGEGKDQLDRAPQIYGEYIDRIKDYVVDEIVADKQRLREDAFPRDEFFKLKEKFDDNKSLSAEEMRRFAELHVDAVEKYSKYVAVEQKNVRDNLDTYLATMDENVNIGSLTKFKRVFRNTSESKNNVQDPLSVQQVGGSADGDVSHEPEPKTSKWPPLLFDVLEAIKGKVHGKTGGSNSSTTYRPPSSPSHGGKDNTPPHG